MKLESPFVFYPRYWAGSVRKIASYLNGFRQQKQVLKRVLADPRRYEYMDIAITPPTGDELESLGLFSETRGGAEAVVRETRVRPPKAAVAA
jgi:hypothetical protein